jgi:colicin import membrane protein
MNAIVSLDSILEPAPGALTPERLFGSGSVEIIVAAIEKDVRAEAFDPSTEEGRDRIKSVAYKIARSKTTLDEIGKDHVAAIKAQSAAIDRERKILRDRLDALKDEVRKPVTEWQAVEKARTEAHETAIAQIRSAAELPLDPSVTTIQQALRSTGQIAQRDWQEFAPQANGALVVAEDKLRAALAVAQKREADAADLKRLQAAEQGRLEAEAKARRDAERLEQVKATEAARAKAAEEAAARAVEQERQRVAAADAAQAAAEQKRQANKRHRDRIHREITLALSEILTGDAAEAEALIEAIAAGRIPHVTINY